MAEDGLTKLIERILDEPHDGTMTKREALARALVAGAIEGNPVALHELLARLWPIELEVALGVRLGPAKVRTQAPLEDMAKALKIVADVSGYDSDGTPSESEAA